VRALIWAIILAIVIAYLLLVNMDRLPEYGADLASAWPFFSILVGFLIIFRRKGRPKHDFFFNNTKIQKQLDEFNERINNKGPKQEPGHPDKK
jgi:hypothetical protein